MARLFRSILTFITLTCLVGPALAEPAAHEEKAPEAAQSVTALSPAIRKLLTQEMHGIQQQMTEILPPLVSGDWRKVSALAARVADGYILKQKLTPEQARELMTTLPAGFKELDSRFHNAASMMSHVAKQGHIELVAFYYYRLTELCITCHARYAKHRFPNLFLVPRAHLHAEGQSPAQHH